MFEFMCIFVCANIILLQCDCVCLTVCVCVMYLSASQLKWAVSETCQVVVPCVCSRARIAFSGGRSNINNEHDQRVKSVVR